MKNLLNIIILSIGFSSIFGCSSEPKMSTAYIDSTEIPTMVTRDVDMLISDSGVIKYKAITPIWYVYENNVANKYWYFPEGIRLDQIDTVFNTELSIEADTAYNYETKQLWHLIKNVKVDTPAGEHIETDELFWDTRKHEVYSDSFIRLERPDATIEGYGFKSNDAFTKYEIRRTSGIFPFREKPVNQVGAQEPMPAEIAPEDSTYFDRAIADSIMDEKIMSEIVEIRKTDSTKTDSIKR